MSPYANDGTTNSRNHCSDGMQGTVVQSAPNCVQLDYLCAGSVLIDRGFPTAEAARTYANLRLDKQWSCGEQGAKKAENPMRHELRVMTRARRECVCVVCWVCGGASRKLMRINKSSGIVYMCTGFGLRSKTVKWTWWQDVGAETTVVENCRRSSAWEQQYEQKDEAPSSRVPFPPT